MHACQWIGCCNAADDHDSGHVFRAPVGTQRRNPVYLWLWDLQSHNFARFSPMVASKSQPCRSGATLSWPRHCFRQPRAIYLTQEWLSTYQVVLPTSIHDHARFEDNHHTFLALVMRRVTVVFKLWMFRECWWEVLLVSGRPALCNIDGQRFDSKKASGQAATSAASGLGGNHLRDYTCIMGLQIPRQISVIVPSLCSSGLSSTFPEFWCTAFWTHYSCHRKV